jgi:hypothetical protein
MSSHKLVFPLVAVLALGACSDSSPAAGEPPLDEAALQLVAETALEVNHNTGTPLPSLHNLLRRTYQAIRNQEEGYVRARSLLRAGQPLKAIVLMLGPEVAEEGLKGVDSALNRLDERLAGKTLPERMQKALARARTLAERGWGAWNAGNPTGALGAALASADLIRSLSPRYQARRAIERATQALRAARAAVAGDPTEAELTALKKARRYRNGAIKAFELKRWRKAWEYALKSASFSQEVLKGRSGG